MKANAPKRKVFQDALDLLSEDPVKDTPVPVNGIVSIPVEEIHPFHDHPCRLVIFFIFYYCITFTYIIYLKRII